MQPFLRLLPLLLAGALWAAWATADVVTPQLSLQNIPLQFLAKRRIDGTFIGYRVMSEAEYNKCMANAKGGNGRLIWEAGRDPGAGMAQIGIGIYSGKTFDTWIFPEGIDDQYIVAIVYGGNWGNVPKITIPALNVAKGCQDLWWKPNNIEGYLSTKRPAHNINDVVRFSQIAGKTELLFQLVIGSNLLGADHDFFIDGCKGSDKACTDRLKREYGEAAPYDDWNYYDGTRRANGAPKQDPNAGYFMPP